jgi:hypothetical protein
MVGRAIRTALGVAAGWLVVTSLPSLARYFRMREL